MEKKEALELFLEKEVKQASQDFVINSMQYLQKETAPQRNKEFIQNFQNILKMCLKEQKEIKFLQIALVRSRALSGKPFYLLETFQEDFYLSEPVAALEMELWWLYQEYGRFCEEIDRQSKRYVFGLDEIVLNRIKLAELADCNRIMRYLFEQTIAAIISTEEYLQFNPKEDFQIQLGEFRGPYELLYVAHPYAEKLGRWWNGISQNYTEEKY